MKTVQLMVAGLFGLFAFLAFLQGQFVYGVASTVPMLAALWMFLRRASAS
jgi:hypothetical protein